MKYLIVRPAMTLTPEEFDRLLLPEEEGAPDTERRPDLAEAWARRMNDAPDLCPTCNRRLKVLTATSGWID